MHSILFLFSLNMILTKGKYIRGLFMSPKYDFVERKITSTVFLFALNMILTILKMPSTVFLFSLNMILTMGKCLRWSFFGLKYDFDEGKMPSVVFLFGLNMILTMEKFLRPSFYLVCASFRPHGHIFLFFLIFFFIYIFFENKIFNS